MPSKYDTYTSSESSSDDDKSNDERGAFSAQALHGTATLHHAPLEHIVAPPTLEQPVPHIVRLPNLEGTLFDRSNNDPEPEEPSKVETDEDDDDDEEDEKDRPARGRQRTVPVAPPVEPPRPIEHIPFILQPPEESPEAKDTEVVDPEIQAAAKQAEAVAMPLEQERSQLEAAEQQQVPEVRHVAAEHLQPPTEYTTWPDAREDTTPVQHHAQPVVAATPAAQPNIPQQRSSASSESFSTPPPAVAPGTGGQPPIPPINRPPESADFNNYAVPNMPAAVNDGYNYNPYNRAPVVPAPRQEMQPQYDNNRAVDGFARLMGVGNFIGNRRTRKRLGKQIEQNQRETTSNFAGVQAQQLRMGEQQRHQAQAIEQLPQSAPTAEHSPLPAAPLAPVEQAPQAPTPAARAEYTPVPTYASQANPNMGPTRLTEARPMPPLPPIERPPEAAQAPSAEQIEQQMTPEDLAAQAPHEARTIRSSWHEAVVDKHGNVIEGAKEYGQGFRQSRREIIRDRAGDAAAVASTAMAGVQQQQGYTPIVQYSGTLPSGMTSPSLPQGMPTHSDPQHQLPATTKRGGAPGPIFWVMLVVIVAAFFAAALI